jgi:hypothetical protein
MQMTFEFFQPAVESEKVSTGDPVLTTIEALNSYIKVCGLADYKGFYMKIKNGLVPVPEGLTKALYLEMAREVYESRAAHVARNKSRSTYFAIRNKNKK